VQLTHLSHALTTGKPRADAHVIGFQRFTKMALFFAAVDAFKQMPAPPSTAFFSG